MDLFLVLLFSFALLLISALHGVYIAYPLLCVLMLIGAALRRRGFALRALLKMAIAGSRKALPVFGILLLIGAVISIWMAAGTVPAIIYYGIRFINPHWFILAAFLLTGLVSVLIGTSFGAAGTIGLALMIMAKGSTVNPHLIAGAVIAGAYLGDRCSPMSSSAHLIATLTRTELYTNLQNMLRTGMLPLMATCLLYLGLSWLYPVQMGDGMLAVELAKFFDLDWIVLLPAAMILGLALLRVEAKCSMLISIAVAIGLAMVYQHYSPEQVLRFAVLGFALEAETPIQTILLGGGVLMMAKVCGVVLISTAIAGMLTGTQALQILERWLQRVRTQNERFFSMIIVSIAAAAFGCTQTIGILLTEQLVRQNYATDEAEQLALDLENTVVVLAPLVPWNIAGLVPATVLMTDWGFIPYAFYLYLVPTVVLLQFWLGQTQGKLDTTQKAARTERSNDSW